MAEATPDVGSTGEEVEAEPEISVDEVFQNDNKTESNNINSGGGSNGSLSGSWGYASVERRLDMNARLSLGKQQDRLIRMLKGIDESLEPKTKEADEKKEMEDYSEMDQSTQSVSDMDQSKGEIQTERGGVVKVPRTLRHLHKKREKLRTVVDEFEEDILKIFHKIEKLGSKVQGSKDEIQQRSASEEYSISFALTGELEPAELPVRTMSDKSKKKKRKDKVKVNMEDLDESEQDQSNVPRESSELSVTTTESAVTEKVSNKDKKKKKNILEGGAEEDASMKKQKKKKLKADIEDDDEDDDTDFFDWVKWRNELKKGQKENGFLQISPELAFFDWTRYRKENFTKSEAPEKEVSSFPPPSRIPKAKWWVRMAASSAIGWKREVVTS